MNLATLRVHTLEAGLDPTSPLTVVLDPGDTTGDVIVLNDYPTPPSAVLRDGQPAGPSMWTSVSASVVLDESDSAQHVWVVMP